MEWSPPISFTSPRYGHFSCVFQDRLFIYGGLDETLDRADNLLVVDLEAMIMMKVNIKLGEGRVKMVKGSGSTIPYARRGSRLNRRNHNTRNSNQNRLRRNIGNNNENLNNHPSNNRNNNSLSISNHHLHSTNSLSYISHLHTGMIRQIEPSQIGPSSHIYQSQSQMQPPLNGGIIRKPRSRPLSPPLTRGQHFCQLVGDRLVILITKQIQHDSSSTSSSMGIVDNVSEVRSRRRSRQDDSAENNSVDDDEDDDDEAIVDADEDSIRDNTGNFEDDDNDSLDLDDDEDSFYDDHLNPSTTPRPFLLNPSVLPRHVDSLAHPTYLYNNLEPYGSHLLNSISFNYPPYIPDTMANVASTNFGAFLDYNVNINDNCDDDIPTGLWSLHLPTFQWMRHDDGATYLQSNTSSWHYNAASSPNTGRMVLLGARNGGEDDEYLGTVLEVGMELHGLFAFSESYNSASNSPSSTSGNMTSDFAQLMPAEAKNDLTRLLFSSPLSLSSSAESHHEKNLHVNESPPSASTLDSLSDKVFIQSSIDVHVPPIPVHRLILTARWPHFSALCRSGTISSLSPSMSNSNPYFSIPESYETISAFVRYLYSDSLDPPVSNIPITDIRNAVVEYIEKRLKDEYQSNVTDTGASNSADGDAINTEVVTTGTDRRRRRRTRQNVSQSNMKRIRRRTTQQLTEPQEPQQEEYDFIYSDDDDEYDVEGNDDDHHDDEVDESHFHTDNTGHEESRGEHLHGIARGGHYLRSPAHNYSASTRVQSLDQIQHSSRRSSRHSIRSASSSPVRQVEVINTSIVNSYDERPNLNRNYSSDNVAKSTNAVAKSALINMSPSELSPYIYHLHKTSISITASLLVMSHLYGLDRLQQMCSDRLHKNITIDTAAVIFDAACATSVFQYDMNVDVNSHGLGGRIISEEGLKSKTGSFILEHFGAVCKTEGFKSISPRSLSLLWDGIGVESRLLLPPGRVSSLSINKNETSNVSNMTSVNDRGTSSSGRGGRGGNRYRSWRQ